MYQTYTKRGLSIMITAGMFGMLSAILDSPLVAMPLLIIEAFSFFDTFNLRNMNDEQRKEYKDDFIWNADSVKGALKIKVKGNKALGIILIVLGIYAIVVTTLRGFTQYEIIESIYWFVKHDIPGILVAAACIYFGIKIVKE